MKAGSRETEADARLATIYQKLAISMATDNNSKNDEQALGYLNKLNTSSPNPRNLELTSDLYAKSGQLDLAIDNLQKASELGGKNAGLDRKLAALFTRRGKQLLAQGNAEGGNSDLDQAAKLMPSAGPVVVLRNLTVAVDSVSNVAIITGELWNPSYKTTHAPAVKIELYDKTSSRVLWTEDQNVIDGMEAAAPLSSKESKAFQITSKTPVNSNDSSEIRFYFDGVSTRRIRSIYGKRRLLLPIPQMVAQ